MKVAKWHVRLLNFVIDFFTIELITLIILSILKAFNFKVEQKLIFANNIEFYSVSFLIFLFAFLTYYYLFEFLTGKTLGKIITKSRIDFGDNKNTGIKLFHRTVSRLLIFEVFWFFKKQPIGIHDRFSKTKVIENK
jgi:uncharacterized RDD family membrane protein YckC